MVLDVRTQGHEVERETGPQVRPTKDQPTANQKCGFGEGTSAVPTSVVARLSPVSNMAGMYLTPGRLTLTEIPGPWWIVSTHGREAETNAARDAMMAGIDCFFPHDEIRKLRCDGRKRKVIRAAMRGYVFIAGKLDIAGTQVFPPEFRSDNIGSIRPVHHRLQSKFLNRMEMLHVACAGGMSFGPWVEELEDAKHVKIEDGPFEGYECEIVKYDGKDYLAVTSPQVIGNALIEIKPSETKFRVIG